MKYFGESTIFKSPGKCQGKSFEEGEIQKNPLLRGKRNVTVIKNKMCYVSKLRSNYTKRCNLLERDFKREEDAL